MIMLFGCVGESMPTRTTEWIQGMGELMQALEEEMREAGELVTGHGLVDPSQARTVRFEAGVTVATDGPYAEVKESLAGFWIVDTTAERAAELASRVVIYTGYPMEVRQIMHESIPAGT
jgi:hypothetical protein